MMDDPSDRNITIDGGIWDGGYTGSSPADGVGPTDLKSPLLGVSGEIQAIGVDGFTFENATIQHSRAIGVQISSSTNVRIENVRLDVAKDGVHINGPSSHIRIANGSHLLGQSAEPDRLDAVVVYKAGNFDTSVTRKILNTALVLHVAVDLERLILLDSLNDPSTVLPGSLQLDRLLAGELLGSLRVLIDAPLWPIVGIEALLAPVPSVGVFVEQVLALAVVGNVLAQVPARFGDEAAKMQHHVGPHRFVLCEIAASISGLLHEDWVKAVTSLLVEFRNQAR